MERENKKRGREKEEKVKDSLDKTAKRQDLNHHHSISNTNIEDNKLEDYKDNYESSDDNYLALDVFDFPWLKESMISKSEEWYLEDTFSLSLHDTFTTATSECFGDYLCESPATCMASIDIPVDNFEENVWSLEMEVVSLLNQPLQQDGA